MDTELFDTFKTLFESEATPENIYQELIKTHPDPAERLSLFNEIRTYFEAFKPIETLSLNDPPIYVADVMAYLSNQIALESYHLPDDIKHGEYLWYNDSDVLKYKRIKTLKNLIRLIDAATVEPAPKREVPETIKEQIRLYLNKKKPICSTYLEYLWLEVSNPEPCYIEKTIQRAFLESNNGIKMKSLENWTQKFRVELSNKYFYRDGEGWEKIVQEANKHQ